MLFIKELALWLVLIDWINNCDADCWWYGTSPFCQGYCPQGMIKTTYSKWGDGKKCWTGTKFKCCVKPRGYDFRANERCDGVMITGYSSLDKAVNACNGNSQCKCLDCRDGMDGYCWLQKGSSTTPNSKFNAYVKAKTS